MSVPQEAIESLLEQPGLFKRLNLKDWVWAAIVLAATAFVFVNYGKVMDAYEIGILALSAPGLIGLGWYWKAFQPYALAVAACSLLGIWLYGGDYGNAEQVFGLKFLFSSQSAVMWMSALFVLATVTYFAGLFANNGFTLKTGSAITWAALIMGFTGLMVRWYESYLIDPEFGHIPVSNLYEVFILFCLITGLLYLYYEGRYKNRTLGGFVLLVISAAVAFLLWYSFEKGADKILPLVPALKSYWMKIHVPANFVGYGAFALAAMTSVAYLLKAGGEKRNPQGFTATRLPPLEMLDDITYKAIALGFAFFTIATILGAMWAAEAWGGYWSWDPKETWALIVWLNYAAWLHLRFSKGWRGVPMAWWAIVGLFVTLFAFLGVNMFLSGLHSYGEL
ncbi:MAG: c-type cytochrome biogenesis protein CcsB [Gammaproteobacteria bacterium]|nr:c-type cytochrome biogenesis protein CcsB [Gammaproteobacteria bacterium]MBU2006458.1 c-type cytochrome biogenesis protein CcsB [Gammaproteobacteria bacterium]